MSAHDHMCYSESSQSELAGCNFSIYSQSETPICIRDSNGNFVYSNAMFSECVKGTEYTSEFWFSKLDGDMQYILLARELETLANPLTASVIKVVIDGSYHWHVLFQVSRINGTDFIIWSFLNNVIVYKETMTASGIRLPSVLNVVHPALSLESQDYEAFCLFFSGLSHKCISKYLGITPATSRNRIARAYERIGLSDRDSMILYLNVNSFLPSIHAYASSLIKMRKCIVRG